MTEPTYRVSFESDEGQGYEVGARVSVHTMNDRFRTVRLNPTDGDYLVMRCERIRDTSWQALRVSLRPWTEPLAVVAANSVLAADALIDALVGDAVRANVAINDARA